MSAIDDKKAAQYRKEATTIAPPTPAERAAAIAEAEQAKKDAAQARAAATAPTTRTEMGKKKGGKVSKFGEGGKTKATSTQADVRKADKSLSDDQDRSLKFKRAVIAMDLAEARKQGKDYNTMYEDTYQDNVRRGILNKDAVKAHRAYELYTPKEVQDTVDSNPGMKKGGSIKGYASGGSVRGSGCESSGKTKGKFV